MTEVAARVPADGSRRQAKPAERAPKLGYLPGLEGFRGVALIAVLTIHTGQFLLPELHGWLLPGGIFGADIFFVLSGFLITALMLPDLASLGRVRFGKFYWRRMVRLVPALFVFIGAHYVYSLVVHQASGPEHSTQLWALTFMYNWRVSVGHLSPGDLYSHFDTAQLWTLAVEGQMYIFWPFLLTALWKFARRPITRVVAIVGLIVGILVLRIVEYQAFGHQWIAVYQRTDTRADAFLVGALVAVCWGAGLIPRRRTCDIAAAIGGGVLLVMLWTIGVGSRFLVYGGFTLIGLVSATVVAGCLDVNSVTNRVLGWSPLRFLGRVSYSVYLYHLAVFIWIVRYHGDWNPWMKLGVALGLSTVLGGLSYLLVERPALRRPKLFGRGKRGEPVEAVNTPSPAPASG